MCVACGVSCIVCYVLLDVWLCRWCVLMFRVICYMLGVGRGVVFDVLAVVGLSLFMFGVWFVVCC